VASACRLLNRPADGQTIMVTASNVLTEIPHVKDRLRPDQDVRPITAVSQVRLILVSNPSVPAQDFAGLLGYIKANPKSLNFASHSAGTASHYAGMMLNTRAGVDMQHIPFAGAPPALAQVMGRQIPLMFDGAVTSIPLIAAGKLRAYGIAGSGRHPRLPNVPTFVELGYPELDISNWYGVVASSKISNELAERINAAIQKAAAVPKLRDQLIDLGFEPVPAQTSAQLAKSVRADFDRNAAIVDRFQIKLNQ
jgi:tripartite-type tricarboxylate transporter receptor subunit TctC